MLLSHNEFPLLSKSGTSCCLCTGHMGSPGAVRSRGMLDVAGRYFLAQTGRSARMDGWQGDAVHIHDSLRAGYTSHLYMRRLSHYWVRVQSVARTLIFCTLPVHLTDSCGFYSVHEKGCRCVCLCLCCNRSTCFTHQNWRIELCCVDNGGEEY